MNEQEKEIFESRFRELGQARAKLDEFQRVHTDMAKSLSHLIHKDREKDERIAKLEAELARVLKQPVVTVEQVKALRARVAASAGRNSDNYVFGDGVVAELDHLCREAASHLPAPSARLDESGEPAAGDYVATPPKTPGEQAGLRSLVRFRWTSGEKEGVVDEVYGLMGGAEEDRFHITCTRGEWHVGVRRSDILEILPEVSR